MKEKFKKQNGITLVALVITIIVLLILAMVSISIVMNQGIMTKSKDAANTHQIAAEKEEIELAYSKYLTEKYNGETPTLTIADANATVTGNEEIGWTITYANGNVYTLSKNGGIEGPTNNGGTTENPYVTPKTEVTYKGQTLKVGDYVDYDEGAGDEWTTDSTKGTGGSTEWNSTTQSSDLTSKTYTTENMNWRVLGLDKDGNLELISDRTTSECLYIKGKAGYYNGEEQLNEMCDALYGQGEKAESARSVNADDINSILGYNKREYKEEYKEDENNWIKVYYGWKTTYKENTSIGDWFKINGSHEYERIREGCNGTEHNIPFINIDGIKATDEAPITIEHENTFYQYNRAEFEDKINKDILDMIFGEGEGSSCDKMYWLASKYIFPSYESAGWGIIENHNGILHFNDLYCSDNRETSTGSYIRPVVTLKSDIQIEKTDTNDGSTLEKACIIK